MVWMEDADVAKGTGLRQSILPCDPKNQQATNNRALFQQHLFEFIHPIYGYHLATKIFSRSSYVSFLSTILAVAPRLLPLTLLLLVHIRTKIGTVDIISSVSRDVSGY